MVTLVLVRHGESEKNVANIVNHDHEKPIPLTTTGRAQADRTAALLAQTHIDYAFVSRFPRAQETARIVLGDRRVPLVVDARLDEIHNGELEGKTLAEYHVATANDRVRNTPPGGETWDALKRRLGEFLTFARTLQGTVLVVSHGHPIAVLRGLIEGYTDEEMERRIPKTAEALRYDL